MKIIATVLVLCILIPLPGQVMADWWRVVPPIITDPAPNEHFAIDEPVTYCWQLEDCVPIENVDYFEVMFANAPPYTSSIYVPEPEGGTCTWNYIRVIDETCWYYEAGHQDNHEPIYWKVRTVYADGYRSNWAVSYHRVGEGFPDVPMPLTITAPIIQKHSCTPLVYHEWSSDPDAVSYEYGFAQAFPNILHLFDDCVYHGRDLITDNHFSCIHDCKHLPIYFLVRALYDDGQGGTYPGNWAISYYFMFDDDCEACNGPIATQESTWGKIKDMYR
ncbi:MAG: hypothetical protein JSV33_00865 [bacterium]|nr:MAG: hypothetical protein JSV33_00865 [bacterium]